MASVANSPEPDKITGGGVAFSFPANNDMSRSSFPPKELPQRLKQRLLVPHKGSLSAEDIDNKLKEADLRRQRFYELLSSKARPKVKRPSNTCLVQENLARRLQAKLSAAEQKRMNVLEEAQMRLATQGELRQVTRHGAELQFKKEREQLGVKVKSRVQQAEANRILLLKASTQRRAAKRERAAESLRQKLARERKYKECIYEAMYQKRAAAEKRRTGFLEAEKKRAHARLLKVRQVAWSVCHKRETERKRIQDILEDRLEKAKKHRAEYLRQRRNLNAYLSSTSKKMNEQGDFLLRKLAWCWRRFVKLRKTTFSLAKACLSLGIDEEIVKTMPFEELAHRMELATTIQTVKALVGRLEHRLMISQAVTGRMFNIANIDHLLRHVAFPAHRDSSSKVSKGGVKSVKPSNGKAQKPVKLSRYQARVLLCAYMIIGHPETVFSGQSECETILAESATNFVREFELLIKIIINGPIQYTKEDARFARSDCRTFRSQLEAFDRAWCSYLHHFVEWKSEDAKLLERDLSKAALQLELSMTGTGNASKDKLMEEQRLLRESVKRLSGIVGIQRTHALPDTHPKASEMNPMQSKASERQNSDDLLKSSTHSSETSSISISCNSSSLIETCQRSGDKACPSFDINGSSLVKEFDSLAPRNATGVTDRDLSLNLMFSENELLVNEIIHEQQSEFADGFDVAHEDHNSLKARVRETMEKAFWDAVMKSMKNDQPDFSWVLKLMKEVRDELHEISPQPWRKEIVETIDVDILEQMLKSGAVDMDYLRSILEFALVTLRKLSAPANDEVMNVSHNKILRELGDEPLPGDESKVPYVLSIIKGLRFTLQEIQTLKREISRARIKLLEPVIRGPAGVEYLKMAFANRHGSPGGTPSSLMLAKQWLSSVSPVVEQEWHEHRDYLSDFTNINDSSQNLLPSTLRTGATTYSVSELRSLASNAVHEQPECPNEPVGLLVRLGLLKLVNRVEGLTLENLPETLKLNVFRLRTVQLQVQKIIVISISMLVFRQSLMVNNLVTSSTDMEYIISECFKQLCKLLDGVEEVGLSNIIDTINGSLEGCSHLLNVERAQDSRTVMASMLAKSLKAGDAVYAHVSHSIYLALRGAVFGGTGLKGRTLVGAALRRVGAAALADRVIKAAEGLIVVATVSLNVHQEWYKVMLENL